MARKKKKATKHTAEAPTSSCLLLCEDVTVSVASDKHTLKGVISEMFSPVIPYRTGTAAAYLRLSNLYANQQIIVRFENVETAEVLFQFDVQASDNSDPLGTHVIILKIPSFVIPRAGRYNLCAIHNNLPFAESMITVRALE